MKSFSNLLNRRHLTLAAVWPSTLACLTMTGCTGSPDTPRRRESNLTTKSLLDPSKASLRATAATKRIESLKGDVPVLTLAFSGADAAEVWRCRASYELVYGNGLQKLSELSKSSPDYRSAAEDAFKRMGGDVAACRTIAPVTTSQTVTDYAASEGKFYYIINPCVTKDSSTTSRSQCSFALELTPIIDYKNTRTAFEIEVLSGMTNAEGRLYGNFNSMRRAAEEANESLTTCTWNEAMKRASQAQLFGLIKLVSGLAVAPLVNGLLAGVGSALDTAINQLLGMAAPKQIDQVECPGYQVKMQVYNDLQSQTVQLAKDVLEARKKLADYDSQYANIDKELTALKSSMK